MKINSDEKLALEFFELEDNFSKKQYKRAYDNVTIFEELKRLQKLREEQKHEPKQ